MGKQRSECKECIKEERRERVVAGQELPRPGDCVHHHEGRTKDNCYFQETLPCGHTRYTWHDTGCVLAKKKPCPNFQPNFKIK